MTCRHRSSERTRALDTERSCHGAESRSRNDLAARHDDARDDQQEDGEIRERLRMLRGTHAGTGLMHESCHKDDPARFIRKWFAWANTLFGELILKLHAQLPQLLKVA